MHKLVRAGAVTFILAICGPGNLAAQDDVVEVMVTGNGLSEDSACKDALRKALEQGGASEIISHSKVENFELIRDTIYARSDGLVTDHTIVQKGEAAGGTFFCKIRAKVSKKVVASTWGEVQNLLDQIGRPAIVVFIQERIDGVPQDSSILESQIENRLVGSGFLVRAGQQVRAIAERESADAASEGNVAKMQAIAKDFGAQIFITGTAQADAAGVRELAGEPTAMYNGDAAIKMFYTDTAELLASESLANWRGGARGFFTNSPQAGKKALENAGQELVERCYASVMKNWATRISAGGEIVLEIEGVNAVDAVRIKKKLQEIDADRIRAVNHALSKGIATFRIQAKMTAESLVEHLLRDDWAALIEVVDFKTNRIQAKRVGG